MFSGKHIHSFREFEIKCYISEIDIMDVGINMVQEVIAKEG